MYVKHSSCRSLLCLLLACLCWFARGELGGDGHGRCRDVRDWNEILDAVGAATEPVLQICLVKGERCARSPSSIAPRLLLGRAACPFPGSLSASSQHAMASSGTPPPCWPTTRQCGCGNGRRLVLPPLLLCTPLLIAIKLGAGSFRRRLSQARTQLWPCALLTPLPLQRILYQSAPRSQSVYISDICTAPAYCRGISSIGAAPLVVPRNTTVSIACNGQSIHMPSPSRALRVPRSSVIHFRHCRVVDGEVHLLPAAASAAGSAASAVSRVDASADTAANNNAHDATTGKVVVQDSTIAISCKCPVRLDSENLRCVLQRIARKRTPQRARIYDCFSTCKLYTVYTNWSRRAGYRTRRRALGFRRDSGS